jgi:AcrR family transcriptional regulator
MPRGARERESAGRKADPRAAILHAAWALIRHYGYQKTTISDIAGEAKLGKGTIYLYFRSKTEIMLGLVELTNERIAKDQERLAGTAASAADRVRACLLHRILTLYDIVHRYPHGEEIIGSLLPEIVQLLERYVQRHGDLLAALLREGCAAGEFRVADPDASGHLLAELLEFLTPPYYRFPSRKALESFANRVVNHLYTGLGHVAAGPSD